MIKLDAKNVLMTEEDEIAKIKAMLAKNHHDDKGYVYLRSSVLPSGALAHRFKLPYKDDYLTIVECSDEL